MTASPPQITQGSSSTLTWSAGNTTSVTLDGAPVADTGTKTVAPGSTMTYTLTAKNPFYTSTATATVTVTPKSAPADLPLEYEFPGAGTQGFSETVTFKGALVTAADPSDTTGMTSFTTSVSKSFQPPGGGTVEEYVPTTISNLRKGTWVVSAAGNGGFAGALTCKGVVVPQAFGQVQIDVYDPNGVKCTCTPACAVGP